MSVPKRARRASSGSVAVSREEGKAQALAQEALRQTRVRVYRSNSIHDDYFFSYGNPAEGIMPGWKTEMDSKWTELSLLSEGEERQGQVPSSTLSNFLKTVEDYAYYHIHVVLPWQYRTTTEEPPRAWEWYIGRRFAEGAPPTPVDDLHITSVILFEPELKLFRIESTGQKLSIPQIVQKVQDAVAEKVLPAIREQLRIAARRAAATAALMDQSELPTALIQADLLPFIDYHRHSSPSVPPLPAGLWAAIRKEGAPLTIDLYRYHGRDVLYVTMDCCDNFDYVYDLATAQELGAPSGGWAGHGDGKLPDWSRNAVRLRRLWTK